MISGKGCIELGQLSEDNRIEWNETFDLQAGDILEIEPLVVHRLLGGSEDLRLIFITPPSHLGEDRIFVD